MADIRHLLDKIRKAIYGKEVRGSLADGLEAVNNEVEDATEVAVNVEQRQDAVEQQFNTLLREWSDDKPIDNAETIAARTNTKESKTYENLGKRLDEEYGKVTSQLAETEKEIEKRRTNAKVRPIITIETDDGFIEDYTDLLPFLQDKGVVASMAIAPGKVGRAVRMNWSQIKELVDDYGWDISSHTLNEIRLDEVSLEEADYQLRESKKALEAQGFKVDHFTYPNGGYNDDIMDLAKKYYKSSGTTDLGYNILPVKSQKLMRVNLRYVSESQLKNYIDHTVHYNAYLILFTHGNQFAGIDFDGSDNGGIVRSNLEYAIDYAKSKGIEFLNRNDAWDEIGNLIDLGNYGVGYSNKNLVMSKRGDVILNNKEFQVHLSKTPTLNDINVNTPIEDFPEDEITYTQIVQDKASGFPENTIGLLVTNRMVKWNGFSFQEYHIYNQNKVYRRIWNNGWKPFELIDSRVHTFKVVTDSAAATTPIDLFKDNAITHIQITDAKASGFPENKAGKLVTDRMVPWNGFSFQEYHVYNSNRVYRRVWNNGWRAWQLISAQIAEGYKTVGEWNSTNFTFESHQIQPNTNYSVILAPTWDAGSIWVSNLTTEGFDAHWEKKPVGNAGLGFKVVRN